MYDVQYYVLYRSLYTSLHTLCAQVIKLQRGSSTNVSHSVLVLGVAKFEPSSFRILQQTSFPHMPNVKTERPCQLKLNAVNPQTIHAVEGRSCRL